MLVLCSIWQCLALNDLLLSLWEQVCDCVCVLVCMYVCEDMGVEGPVWGCAEKITI